MSDQGLSRIEKRILIRAPRKRVFEAIVDTGEFSGWFGCETSGRFEPGARVEMTVSHQGRRIPFHVIIQEVLPDTLISWRWHPGMPDDSVDYAHEPTTLVEFHLADAEGGTLVTVVESGFDRISLARRASVFADNEQGWEAQTKNLEQYVVGKSG